MAAAASTSMAATAVLLHRLPAARPAAVFCPLPQRPTLSATPFKLLKESRRSSQLLVKATSSEESSLDTTELFNDLKGKWDAVENKTTVILYGGASIVAIWLASTVVGAVNSVPLLPKIMELVGLGYTGWFVYRYLLFKVRPQNEAYLFVFSGKCCDLYLMCFILAVK
ncbi:protein CURVATURE THYLAKOID 1A, chloroplastic-like isoform X2 [Salvia miltiorrhiza]|uniref:protein CURVATURE THYLAKOID 1A, chloroplastic-like isoform X2 n=1 Tax=Salvia miltiorrhiza TaxID=226208 RepID=UPI0025AC5D2B|nr:protein CURVATURE THYLAKOID 1A, chloroplastic-like isoform X2 [Salvia miltiorrhiza]